MPNSKRTTGKRLMKKATEITTEERKEMVSEAAYYLAEQRGFKSGRHLHDWLEAEAKIERIYGKAE